VPDAGVIDLRSDTVTAPSADMRRAMAAAPVGDDVYGEDPTVRALEEKVADLFGFEAALFTVTGSLANLLAVRALVGVGEEVLCESGAHIARAEMGAHGAFTGLTMRTWSDPDGYVDLRAIEDLVAPDLGPFFVRTTCISAENTHNFAGGRVQPVERLVALRALADRHGVAVHVDGARVWNAHVATGSPLPSLGAEVADTMGVCLSKGMGAPVGSLMLGTAEQVVEARVWRKRLGGGWRQAGVLAAAGLWAVEHNLERLADDHANAQLIAGAVADAAVRALGHGTQGAEAAATSAVDPAAVDSNIVVIRTPDAPGVVARCKDEGVLVSAVGAGVVRVVTHLDISEGDAKRAADVIARAL
jgi:threonine aldolase